MDDVYRVYRVYSKQQTYQARKVELSKLIPMSYDNAHLLSKTGSHRNRRPNKLDFPYITFTY